MFFFSFLAQSSETAGDGGESWSNQSCYSPSLFLICIPQVSSLNWSAQISVLIKVCAVCLAVHEGKL